MSENAKRLPAEPEESGPELRGKSLAEIAAMLMQVPGAGAEDGDQSTPAPREHPEPEPPPLRAGGQPSAPPPVPGAAASSATLPTSAAPEAVAQLPSAPSMAPGVGPSPDPLRPMSSVEPLPRRLRPSEPDLTTPRSRRDVAYQRIVKPRIEKRWNGATLAAVAALLAAGLIGTVVVLAVIPSPFTGPARKQKAAVPAPVIQATVPAPREPLAPEPRILAGPRKGTANEAIAFRGLLDGGSGSEALTLTGFAPGTSFSAGSEGSKDEWVIAARDLDAASVHPPADFVGTMQITIRLASPTGRPMDSQVVPFEWVVKKEDRLGVPAQAPRAPPVAPPPPDAQEVALLIERADRLLRSGDITAARTLLRRAARGGNAQAALELGRTFDPIFLARRGAVGLDSDVAQARQWYEQALKLGSTEASGYLEQLAAEAK